MLHRQLSMRHLAPSVAILLFAAATTEAQDKTSQEQSLGPLVELRTQYDSAMADWNSKYSNRRDSPASQRIERYDAWPGWTFIPRVVDLGTKYPTAPSAFESLKWFINDLANAVGPCDREYFAYDEAALTAVRKHHLADARVTELFGNCAFYPTPAREDLLRTCLETGVNKTVRGLACFYLAECLQNKAKLLQVWFGASGGEDAFEKHLESRQSPGFVSFARTIDKDRSQAESKALYQRVVDEFDDVVWLREHPFTSAKPTLGFLVRLQRIQASAPVVGQPAPDIVAKDLEGTERKLRDYRGKVVILHYWASWCPPCIEKIAQLQRLVKKYPSGDLCLIGLNYDRERQAACRLVAEKFINWPSLCLFELGESVGLLAANDTWPSVIVIDRKGVLRYHGSKFVADDEDLDKTVETLLREPTGNVSAVP